LEIGEWIKRWGHIFLTAEIAELAEKIRGILSVLCGRSGEMVWKAHEHSHSRKMLPQKKRNKINVPFPVSTEGLMASIFQTAWFGYTRGNNHLAL
jgi:hypothetical protein